MNLVLLLAWNVLSWFGFQQYFLIIIQKSFQQFCKLFKVNLKR